MPADFDFDQIHATVEAAKLAGISYSETLAEPIAAAIAYGLEKNSTEGIWLVYDLGGGTFDVAVIKNQGGSIKVIGHGGDKMLGGELIDWDIVDKLFVPVLKSQYPLSGFERANDKWLPAFAKLKLKAEGAKMELSNSDNCQITIDPLCQAENGEWVTFEYDLDNATLNRIVDPLKSAP